MDITEGISLIVCLFNRNIILYIIENNLISQPINENKVNFEVTDLEDSIKVIYEGLLPDLFKEGKGIVVLGKYIDGVFYADEVFAKHDENYMPPNLELS